MLQQISYPIAGLPARTQRTLRQNSFLVQVGSLASWVAISAAFTHHTINLQALVRLYTFSKISASGEGVTMIELFFTQGRNESITLKQTSSLSLATYQLSHTTGTI